MIAGSFILWLAVPLGWLWVGSKLNQSLDPSFGAYVAIAVGIPATMLVLDGSPYAAIGVSFRDFSNCLPGCRGSDCGRWRCA